MLIVLAVIAPVWSAGPNAVAHCPTATADDVAEAFWVNVVLAVKVTVEVRVVSLSLGELELGFFVVLVLDGGVGSTGTVPFTTNFDPESDVTLPKAVEKIRAAAPEGIALLGKVPPGKVPPGGRNPPNPPAPPRSAPANPRPWVHDPVELGWVIDTVVAVKWFEVDLADFAVELLLVAVTQSPTTSSDEGMLSVWVKFVDWVQVTVTWPLVGFCTSIEDAPTSAAMVPEAVDTDGAGGGVVFGDVVAAPAVPPTAATLVRRTSPSPRATLLQRDSDLASLECSITTAI